MQHEWSEPRAGLEQPGREVGAGPGRASQAAQTLTLALRRLEPGGAGSSAEGTTGCGCSW